MPKLIVKFELEVDTDKIVENMKLRGIVDANGKVDGMKAREYLHGYINGGTSVKMDTTDAIKQVIDDLDQKLGTKDLF